MSVANTASGNYFSRTTGGFFDPAVFTSCLWFYLTADTNSYSPLWGLSQSGDVNGYVYFYSVAQDGTTFVWENGQGGTQLGSFNYSLNTWYFVAISRAGTGSNQTTVYRMALGDTSLTSSTGTFGVKPSLSGDQFNEEYLFTTAFATSLDFPGKVAAMKQWDVALTVDELWNEAQQFLPVRMANLHSWRPMTDSSTAGLALDYAGSSRDFTMTGTLAVAENPAIAWKQGPSRRIFSALTLLPSGIASAGAFGTAIVELNINATGIASTEAFGTASVELNIDASGISSAEAFGTATVQLSSGTQTITLTGIPSLEAFGTATVIREGAVGSKSQRIILLHNNDGFLL